MWWGCEGLIYLIARLMCVRCMGAPQRTSGHQDSQLQFTEANINLSELTYIHSPLLPLHAEAL